MSLGEILDARGVTADIDDGALIGDAVVILRTHLPDGETSVHVAFSEGLDWITRRGLIEIARDCERVPTTEGDDE